MAGIAFSPDAAQRFMYLADYGNSHVVVMDRKSLTILYQFGMRSAKPGDFQGPHHLAVELEGRSRAWRRWRRGTASSASRFKGLSNTLPPNALTRGAARGHAGRAGSGGAGSRAGAEPRAAHVPAPGQRARQAYPPWTSTMANPYRVTPNWPQLGDIKPGAAIGIIPDGKGGTWLHHRSEPPILHIDASGNVDRRFGNGMFVQAHGFCQDRDGNFWAGDSGPFADNPATKGRGFQLFKFSPDGKVLLTLGKAGVSKAGKATTFIGPTACAIAPNGEIIVADGHWPRPTDAQQDGDRLVRIKTDGTFVAEYGKMGTAPGRVHGPARAGVRLAGPAVRGRSLEQPRADLRPRHAVRGRVAPLRAAERHRDPARRHAHRGRLRIAASSSAGRRRRPRAAATWCAIPGGATASGSAARRTARCAYYVQGTRPEGMGADERGNVFAGLTGGCDASPSGGCLQKWVKK